MNTDEADELDSERRRGHGWGTVRPVRWKAIESIDPSSVLDVGCSTGDYVFRMLHRGIDAYGVDLLADEAWGRSSTSRFAQADATALPCRDRSVDGVIAFETLEHVSRPDEALVEWLRVSREFIVLSVPNTESPDWCRAAGLNYQHYVDRTHVNFFTEQSIRRLLESVGFSTVRVELINPINPFVPALDALGLPPRLVAGIGRRMTKLARRRHYSGLLVIGRRV